MEIYLSKVEESTVAGVELKNLIVGVYLPDLKKADFVAWYKKYIGRKPTKEEYDKWRQKIEDIGEWIKTQ